MRGIYITNVIERKIEVNNIFNFNRNSENTTIEISNVLMSAFDSSFCESYSKTDLNKQIATNKHLSISLQGSIYNLADIRAELTTIGIDVFNRSEAEIILKGYEKWGDSLLNKLNGDFVFAIYDDLCKTILCARDKIGVEPCYYSFVDGKIEICSRIRPLIKKDSIISKEALAYYFFYGFVPTPISIIEDIKKIRPGHYIKVDLLNKSIKEKAYWELEKIKPRKIAYKEAKEELHCLLKDAVHIRSKSDIELGAFLSGGIDSSIVASILAKHSSDKIYTYTVAFEDEKYDEGTIAKQFADIIGSNHLEFLFKTKDCVNLTDKYLEIYDEPFASGSALATIFLDDRSNKYSSCTFTGEGGDETFLSSGDYKKIRIFKKLSVIPFYIRKRLSFLFKNNKRLYDFLNISDIDSLMDISLYGTGKNFLKNKDLLNVDKYYQQYKSLSKSPVQNLADFFISFLWENAFLVKVGRASSAYSMNLRSPLLDYRIVEYSRSLPLNYRLKGHGGKRILKDILEEYIPRDIFEQPKKGFAIPLGALIRKELKNDVMTTINLKYHEQYDIVDIDKFNQMMDYHMNGLEDNGIYIWRVFIFNKWVQKYI